MAKKIQKRHALPASAKGIPAKIYQATAHRVVGQRQNHTNLICPHWQCCPGENKIKLRTKLPPKNQMPILTHLTVHNLPTTNKESYPHKRNSVIQVDMSYTPYNALLTHHKD